MSASRSPQAPTVSSIPTHHELRPLVRQATKGNAVPLAPLRPAPRDSTPSSTTTVNFLDKSVKRLSGRFSALDMFKGSNIVRNGSHLKEIMQAMHKDQHGHRDHASQRTEGSSRSPHKIQPVPDAPDRVVNQRRASGSATRHRHSSLQRGSTTGSIHNLKIVPTDPEMLRPSPSRRGLSASQTMLIAATLKKKAQIITQRRRKTKHMQLMELAGIQSRHKKVLHQYSIRVVRDEEKTEEEVHLTTDAAYLILPSHQWYKAWQLSTLFIILYQSIMIPYQLAFDTSDTPPTQDYASMAFNSIFCVDLLFTLNCAIAHPSLPDTYITERWIIWRKYLKSWCALPLVSKKLTRRRFLLDFLACFPIDVIVYSSFSGASASNNRLHILGLLKILRLPRLLRLARFVRILRILRIPPEWKRWLLYSRYAHLIRLGSLLVSFVYLIHIFNCIWGGYVTDPYWEYAMFGASSENASTYILGFYFVLTTVMGQNSMLQSQAEYTYACMLIIIGSILMATVFGNVANLISNFYENQNNYKKKMEQLLGSMNLMKLPLDLQNRINEYYQVMWERHGTLDGRPLMFTNELSKNLSVEVELYLRMDMINRVPVFQKCSKTVVQEIVMQLQLQVYLPGDYIVVKGEIGFDMYFVQNGTCEVTKPASPDPRPFEVEIVLKVLTPGDYFGEIALLMNCKRTANVRAVTFSELCVLTRSAFERITAQYVEDRATIETFITEMYDPKALEAIRKQQNDDGPSPHEARLEARMDTIMDYMAETNSKIERLEALVTLLVPPCVHGLSGHQTPNDMSSPHRPLHDLTVQAQHLPPMQRQPTLPRITDDAPLVDKTALPTRASTRSAKIIPYAPDRLSFAISEPPSARPLSLRESSDDLIAGVAVTSGAGGAGMRPNVAALRAVGHLKKKQKERHNRRLQQQLDTDRHQAILKQYTIRTVTHEAETRADKLPFLLVHPSAGWYKSWQLATLGLICYQSFQTPYQLAFSNSNSDPMHDYFSIATNTIFGIDMLLSFNTAMPDPVLPDRFIVNRKLIIKKYILGWFLLDFMACFPIDIVLYTLLNQSGNRLSILSLLKSLRLPRLLRLARLVRVLKILQMPVEWKRWILYSRYSHLIRLFTMIVAFIFVVHIKACIWHGSVAAVGWQNATFGSGTDVDVYVLSYFFTLVTLVGQNMNLTTQAEYIFAIYLLIMGAMLMAIVFGNVANLLSNFYENQNNYKRKMEWLFESMGAMKLPLDLQNRINDYYQVMWERHGTLNGQMTVLTQELSRNLAIEVELYLRMEMINRVPIFHSCSKKVVQEIVMRLAMDVFLPGDYIVVRGEMAWEMYFVQSGVCEVTKGGRDGSSVTTGLIEDEVVLRHLTQGDFFGEIALLMQCKRTANVRAQTFSELCVLTREIFEAISAKFTEDRERMEEIIVQRYHPDVLKQIEMERHQDTKRLSSGHQLPAVRDADGHKIQQQEPKPDLGRHLLATGLPSPPRIAESPQLVEVLTQLSERMGALERKVQNIEDAQRHCFNKIFTVLQVRKTKKPTSTTKLPHPSVSQVSLPSHNAAQLEVAAQRHLLPTPSSATLTEAKRPTMVQSFLRSVAKVAPTSAMRQSHTRLPRLLQHISSRNKGLKETSRLGGGHALASSISLTTLMAPKPPRVVPFAPEPTSNESCSHALEPSLAPGPVGRHKSIRDIVTENMIDRIPTLHDRRSRLLDQVALGQRHKKVLTQYQIRLRTRRASTLHQMIIYVPHIVYPTSTWVKIWRLVLVLLTYYQLVVIPYAVAFRPHDDPLHDVVDIITNLCFFFDMILTFNTAIRVSDLAFVTTRSAIARHYIHGWFLSDIFSIVPWDILVHEIGLSQGYDFTFVNVFKMFRLSRIPRACTLTRILRYLRVSDEWKRWVLYSRYANIIRLLSLVALFVFLVHLLACIWYLFIVPPDWIEFQSQSSSTGELLTPYILSAYYIVTTVTGQSNLLQTNAEFAFSAIVIILGSLWIAVVFGNVGNLIANYYANQDLFQQKMESLFSSMTLLHLPVDLQNRIIEYYQTMYTRHGTLNGRPFQFVQELSKNLTVEVGLFLRMNMITRSPMFQNCSPEFVQELVMKLAFQVYLGNDYIVVRGEVGSEMYFVQNGTCELRKPTTNSEDMSFERPTGLAPDIKLRILEEGDHFGELALLMNVKHAATVKAVTFVELCVLTREVFLAVTEKYFEDKLVIENFIVEKYDPTVMQSLLAIQTNPKQEHQRSIVAFIGQLTDRLNEMQDAMDTMHQQVVQLEAASNPSFGSPLRTSASSYITYCLVSDKELYVP
ncbi:Voltage-gated Ion Channel (VIC) Superfamily [Achlya hypogyna]|uniref:Voltage-gated Ion Channel (VIC) Superfamily n=1 Tax=Achlya hypogyna TaxID=1202772 RepID=A0A1V9ZTV4_ACHHY|nr:Voltage-gated Ion Channel (VIC) Superfamily [Achlya hypogyna]